MNLGAAGIPLAPFAARMGALGAAHSRPSQERFTEAETRLDAAFRPDAGLRSLQNVHQAMQAAEVMIDAGAIHCAHLVTEFLPDGARGSV